MESILSFYTWHILNNNMFKLYLYMWEKIILIIITGKIQIKFAKYIYLILLYKLLNIMCEHFPMAHFIPECARRRVEGTRDS